MGKLSENYLAYINSPEWRVRRDKLVARFDNRCQICYSTGPLNVHHRTYARLKREWDTDLTVLCMNCHDLYHAHTKRVTNGAPVPTKPKKPPEPKPSFITYVARRRKSKRKLTPSLEKLFWHLDWPPPSIEDVHSFREWLKIRGFSEQEQKSIVGSYNGWNGQVAEGKNKKKKKRPRNR